MLRKSQMLLLFLFLITGGSYQKGDTQKDNQKSRPLSSKSDSRGLSEALSENRPGPTNFKSIPPPRDKEPITISSLANNGRIHKLYYVIPGSGGPSHKKRTHEVKVRLRTRRHADGNVDRRRLHRRQRRDLTKRWRVQRLKRELAASTLDDADKKSSEPHRNDRTQSTASKWNTHDKENGAPSGETFWRQSQQLSDKASSNAQTHYLGDEASIGADMKKWHSIEHGAPRNNGMWKDSKLSHNRVTSYVDSHNSRDGTLTSDIRAGKLDAENKAPNNIRMLRDSRQMRDDAVNDATSEADMRFRQNEPRIGADTRNQYGVRNAAPMGDKYMSKESRKMRTGITNNADNHYSMDGTLTNADRVNRAPNNNNTWRDSQQVRDDAAYGATSDADMHYIEDKTGAETRKLHDDSEEFPDSGNIVWKESRKTHGTSKSYADNHYSVDVDKQKKYDVENESPDNVRTTWKESRRKGATSYVDSHYSVDKSVDTQEKHDISDEDLKGITIGKDSQQTSDADVGWRERQPEQNITVKSQEEHTSDDNKNFSQPRQGRKSISKVLNNIDERPESQEKSDLKVTAPNIDNKKKFEWRQSKEIVIDDPDDDVDRKQEPETGVPSQMDMTWRERMRIRAPRDHKFVTKSQLKIDRVMNEVEPPPVIKVYSMPEENQSKVYRAGKSRDSSYSRAPTKRIIYYATLPEIIRGPATPEWFARHSGAFGQRGIGASVSNSLLSQFPSRPGQGIADIARIQSALMDVRPPRDNLTPQSPQFTVVDIDRYPSLNDITSTNSVQSSGSHDTGSGQSLSDSSATEGPASINSLLPQLNNNFISSLVTPLQMNGAFNGYQPAPYYPGPFPTRHHRFPLPMDGYRPYIGPPNSLGNLANYKIEHPSGSHNSGPSNLISSTRYPSYYEYTSSRVDPLKNHLLFSPTWGPAGPPLYERLTPSTHSSHSVVIDSQSLNINSNNITTGNSTRITPPIITNVTEHYESREKK